MKKNGQALIEALAVIFISVSFFTFAFSVFMKLFSEIKSEQQQLESQLCKLSRNKRSCNEKGFILISTLMQMLGICFGFTLIKILMLQNEVRFQALHYCLEESLQIVSTESVINLKLKEMLENYILEKNKLAEGFLKIQTTLSAPTFESNTISKSDRKLEYDLQIKFLPTNRFDLITLNPIINNFKCGAERICSKEDCSYSIIADKY
jgi:hypothetical protein